MNNITIIDKRKWWRRMLVPFLLLLAATPGKAQTYIEYNAPTTISGGTVDEYNYIFIGPNAVITIEQDWYILTNNLYIHPTATITGGGTLHIMNPATFGTFPNGATIIDGGGITLGVPVSVENPNNLTLGTINPAAVAAGLGWTDPGTAGTNNLVIGNTLNFGASGGDVLLNSQQLVFTASGTYTYSDLNTVDFPGTDPAPPATPSGAILATNGTGHVVKQGLATSFKFPVGMAEGNYTPATVSSPSTAADFSVQVKNYAASVPVESNPAEGMDRTWHVFASSAVNATLALQHNTSTNGASYTDAPAFVTQYQGNAVWGTAALNVDYTGAGDIAGSAVHSHTYLVPATGADNGTYFSKASDPISPLPVTWLSFDAKPASNCAVQLDWSTASEQNSAWFFIERNEGGDVWKEIGRVKAAGNASTVQRYTYTDATPGSGWNNYRLRQEDLDGRKDYSAIRSVNNNCGANIVKVNPTLNKNGMVYVSMPQGYEQAQLRLLGMNSQQLPVRTTGNGLVRTVYLQSLPAGTYILQVIHQNKQQSFKIVYAP